MVHRVMTPDGTSLVDVMGYGEQAHKWAALKCFDGFEKYGLGQARQLLRILK